jgi:type II secretory pathway pseudopilin PulG
MRNNFQFSIFNFQSILNDFIFKNLKFRHLDLNRNLKLEIINSCRRQVGFTIVEVLVVALIIGIVGYMMSDIITRSLAGSQKTAVIGNSKQNGQVAIDALSSVIRNSEIVACLDSNWTVTGGTGSTIVLYTKDARYVRFMFHAGDGTTTNGYFAQDMPNVTALLLNGNPYGAITDSHSSHRICSTDAVTGVILSGETILTDRDTRSGVNIDQAPGPQPIFTVVKNPGSADIVTIQFSVTQAVAADAGFQNRLITPTQFRETIQLR